MSLFRIFSRWFFPTALCALPMLAQAVTPGFLTSRDVLTNDAGANIYLRNSTHSAVTVYGLYVRQLAWVAPGQSCDQATEIYPQLAGASSSPFSANMTAGAVVTPTPINAGQSAELGGNYLYNMIYGANFYVYLMVSSSPPGCALPGCTWGNDHTTYHWCMYLGAMAPVSVSADYSMANVPPAVSTASSAGNYDYNLISTNAYAYLGPITCDDQNLRCSVATPQTQSF